MGSGVVTVRAPGRGTGRVGTVPSCFTLEAEKPLLRCAAVAIAFGKGRGAEWRLRRASVEGKGWSCALGGLACSTTGESSQWPCGLRWHRWLPGCASSPYKLGCLCVHRTSGPTLQQARPTHTIRPILTSAFPPKQETPSSAPKNPSLSHRRRIAKLRKERPLLILIPLLGRSDLVQPGSSLSVTA